MWVEMERRGWSHAKLAHELAEDTGRIARVLYGDRGPGRRLSGKFLARFGIAIEMWDQPLPPGWQPWGADSGPLPTDAAHDVAS